MEDEFQVPDTIHLELAAEHAEDALARFRDAGFDPVSVERSEGSVTYFFATPSDDRMAALLYAIPTSYYWNRGYIVGEGPVQDT